MTIFTNWYILWRQNIIFYEKIAKGTVFAWVIQKGFYRSVVEGEDPPRYTPNPWVGASPLRGLETSTSGRVNSVGEGSEEGKCARREGHPRRSGGSRRRAEMRLESSWGPVTGASWLKMQRTPEMRVDPSQSQQLLTGSFIKLFMLAVKCSQEIRGNQCWEKTIWVCQKSVVGDLHRCYF